MPLEDFERFSYSPEQLASGVEDDAFLSLMRHQIARARAYYDAAGPLIEMVEPESRAALWTLVSIYQGVLGVIERNVELRASRNGARDAPRVLPRRAALSSMEKAVLVMRAAAKHLQQRAGGRPDWRLRG